MRSLLKFLACVLLSPLLMASNGDQFAPFFGQNYTPAGAGGSAPTYVNSASSPAVGSCAVSFTAANVGDTLYGYYVSSESAATGIPTDVLSETWTSTPLGAQTAQGQFLQVWHTTVTATSANTITFQTTANHGYCVIGEYTPTTFDHELVNSDSSFNFASAGPISITAAHDICIGFGLLQGTDATATAPFTVRRLIGGSGSGYFLMDGPVSSACTIATTNAAAPVVMWGITSQ